MPVEKQKRKKLQIAGKGGSPGQPYDDPEKGKGPFVPAPKKLAMKDGWKENEIKGTTKGKKKKDIKLPNIPKAKKKTKKRYA